MQAGHEEAGWLEGPGWAPDPASKREGRARPSSHHSTSFAARPPPALLHPPRTPLTLARHALPVALTPSTSFTARRTLASRSNKKKVRDEPDAGKIVNTDALVPGSQRIVQSEEYVKAEGKMKATLDFFRKEVAALEMRASGRVTPAVLAPVRVHVPSHSLFLHIHTPRIVLVLSVYFSIRNYK